MRSKWPGRLSLHHRDQSRSATSLHTHPTHWGGSELAPTTRGHQVQERINNRRGPTSCSSFVVVCLCAPAAHVCVLWLNNISDLHFERHPGSKRPPPRPTPPSHHELGSEALRAAHTPSPHWHIFEVSCGNFIRRILSRISGACWKLLMTDVSPHCHTACIIWFGKEHTVFRTIRVSHTVCKQLVITQLTENHYFPMKRWTCSKWGFGMASAAPMMHCSSAMRHVYAGRRARAGERGLPTAPTLWMRYSRGEAVSNPGHVTNTQIKTLHPQGRSVDRLVHLPHVLIQLVNNRFSSCYELISQSAYLAFCCHPRCCLINLT